MKLNVRLLEEGDLERTSELESRSFSMPWKKEDFAELIERENAHYFVITLDDVQIGTAGYTYNGFEGYINNVVIDSDYRGHGYSKVLLKTLIDEGVSCGISEFTLEVRVSNTPAVKLYESLGFVSEGVRKNFYERPTEDAYVMWLRLNNKG